MSENNISKKQFSGFLGNRVLDFNASKAIKAKTGVSKSVPADIGQGEPLSPKTESHIQDMLKLNAPKKQSLSDKIYSKFGKYLEL